MHIEIKTNETSTKKKYSKETRCRCNGKQILPFPSALYFALHL